MLKAQFSSSLSNEDSNVERLNEFLTSQSPRQWWVSQVSNPGGRSRTWPFNPLPDPSPHHAPPPPIPSSWSQSSPAMTPSLLYSSVCPPWVCSEERSDLHAVAVSVSQGKTASWLCVYTAGAVTLRKPYACNLLCPMWLPQATHAGGPLNGGSPNRDVL